MTNVKKQLYLLHLSMKRDQGETFQSRKARKDKSPIVNTGTGHEVSAWE